MVTTTARTHVVPTDIGAVIKKKMELISFSFTLRGTCEGFPHQESSGNKMKALFQNKMLRNEAAN